MECQQRSKRNIKPFNGDHYSIWKFRIKALIAEEGARPVLEEPPQERTENWERMEMIAKGCIIEHLSDTMIGIVTEEETARDILKKLDAIYERKSLATQLAVQKKLLSFKVQGDTLLMEHFLKFDEMLIELIAAGGVVNEMGKVAHLLLTLPSSYDGVVTAIQTLADENLTLAFVKTRLLDHETKLKQESSDTSAKVLQVEAEYSRNKTKPFNYRRNKNNFRKYQEKKIKINCPLNIITIKQAAIAAGLSPKNVTTVVDITTSRMTAIIIKEVKEPFKLFRLHKVPRKVLPSWLD